MGNILVITRVITGNILVITCLSNIYALTQALGCCLPLGMVHVYQVYPSLCYITHSIYHDMSLHSNLTNLAIGK